MKYGLKLLVILSGVLLATFACKKKSGDPLRPLIPLNTFTSTTTPTQSLTPTISGTFTHTGTSTNSPTASLTYTNTFTPTHTQTPTITGTILPTPVLQGEILFSRSFSTSGSNLYKMNPDGTGVVQLTFDSPGVRLDGKWNHDKSKIVYLRDFEFMKSNVFTMNADGTGVSQLTNYNGTDFAEQNRLCWPLWSPDGSQIAYTCTRVMGCCFEVRVMDADGGNNHAITNYLPDSNTAWALQWVSNTRLLITSRGSGMTDKLYEIDSNGTNRTLVFDQPGYVNYDGAWNPNRTLLAFYGENTSAANPMCYTMIGIFNGSSWWSIYQSNGDYVDEAFQFVWSPDGNYIAYSHYDYSVLWGRSTVTRIQPNGLFRTELSHAGYDWERVCDWK